MAKKTQSPIHALIVKQWLKNWDLVKFDNTQHRRKPEPNFYIFKLSAAELKRLSGIHRRTTSGSKSRDSDLGIQRRHDEKRSKEIREYVTHGFPWSDLSASKRKSGDFSDLRKPGWLPTSIVLNILTAKDKRREETVNATDLIQIEHLNSDLAVIHLPPGSSSENWKPKDQYPIEIIDGQHRLWAFEETLKDGDFELPVVAFHGLDISWQAYLFWTINIKPKRINASLAYDLYPLLRTEDWLERFSGHSIYRETRAQEITSALWGYPNSVWFQKINMLGEPGLQMVSQAAWIRSLMSSYIKAWENRRGSPGGLFGSPIGEHDLVLPWNGAQQAGFVIYLWNTLGQTINERSDPWSKALRAETPTSKEDLAFLGPHSLLNTDQGVRGILNVTNDMTYLQAKELKLDTWEINRSGGANDFDIVEAAIKSLGKLEVAKFIKSLAIELAKFDWRTSTAQDLTEEERSEKLVYRGSGGYSELRRRLLKHLASGSSRFSRLAKLQLKTF